MVIRSASPLLEESTSQRPQFRLSRVRRLHSGFRFEKRGGSIPSLATTTVTHFLHTSEHCDRRPHA